MAAPATALTPLVERDSELATVRAVMAGGGGALVITGPAGVGKSRLLREGLGTTPAVRVMASPVAPVPFGVVADLLPDAGPDPPPAGSVREYVTNLRRRPDTVLVVEDLHWADADSLAVLVDFARAPDGPVLAATTRDEPNRPLVAALAALASSPDVTMLTLGGLSTGGVAAMLEWRYGVPVPARTALRIRRRTDGLPYWVEALAGSAALPDLAGAALPDLAGAALRQRVDAAGPAGRRVAEAAAVIGRPVDLALLGQVLSEPPASLLSALRRLVEAWIVAEEPAGRFAFRHALTREAVAARVPDPQRRQWHARAYHWLRQADAGDAVLAHHAAGAGLAAETVEPALRGAAALLAAGSGAEALRLVELALEAGAVPAWPAHALAARAAYAAGWFDEAGPHADAWRTGAAAAGEAAEVAGAECLRATLRWHAGDQAGQWAALEAAMSQPGLTTRDEVLVRAARSQALLRSYRLSETIAEADRVLALAAGTGQPAARRGALVDKGTALCIQAERGGDPSPPAEGLALLATAERESAAAGDLVTLGRALNNGLDARMAGRPASERWAIWDATWQQARELGLTTALGKIVRRGVDLAYATGQWERGWRVVTARLPEETDQAERVVLTAKTALLALEADRVDQARGLAARSASEAAGMDQFWAVQFVALVEVALAARTETPARTARALTRYREVAGPAEHAEKPHRAAEAAWWAIDAGVPPAAVRAFLAGTLPDGLPDRLAGPLELALAEAAGDDARASQIGERLFGADRGGDHRGDLAAVTRADALTRWGRSLVRAGRAAEAVAAAAEAATLLASWPGPRREAARTLSGMATRTGPALTPREREVSGLVAEGLSNRDIAERLGVSPRTVAVHLTRILTKTGCASRTELAVRHVRSARA